jgi:hypothetical protein
MAFKRFTTECAVYNTEYDTWYTVPTGKAFIVSRTGANLVSSSSFFWVTWWMEQISGAGNGWNWHWKGAIFVAWDNIKVSSWYQYWSLTVTIYGEEIDA